MAFAGHLKSIDLYQSSRPNRREQLSSNVSNGEKDELQQQLRLKALELEHLKSKLQGPVSRDGYTFSNNAKVASTAVVTIGSTDKLVDDRGNFPSRSLWVGNTPHGITTSELRATFAKYGRIESTKCLNEYSFVNFEDVESAISAWRECHELELYERGRPLWIRFTGTQAESRRTKESKVEPRLSTTLASQSSQDLSLHKRSLQEHPRSSHVEGIDSGRISTRAPPSEPRSHRRDISPPPLWRADTYRPTIQPVRSSRKSSSRESRSRTRIFDDRISRRRSSCRSLTPSLSDRSVASSTSRVSSPWPRNSSPLPWERSSRKRKSSSSNELPSGMTDSQDHTTTLIKTPISRSLCRDVASIGDKALISGTGTRQQVNLTHSGRSVQQSLPGYETGSKSPMVGSQVFPLISDIKHAEQDRGVEHDRWPPPWLNHPGLSSAAAHSPTFPMIQSSPFLHPNKRLRLDKDDSSSVHSERSSMSTSSDRDRKCRGCKKPGNSKGLHVLYKCITCPRRYHGFCGRPKPNEIVDKSHFTCGKCLRHPRDEEVDVDTNQAGTANGENQLASPPLSHHNSDAYLTAFYPESIPVIGIGASQVAPRRPPKSPSSPTAPSKHHPTVSHNSVGTSTSKRSHARHDEITGHGHTAQQSDSGESGQHRAFESTDIMRNKYKTVTCPWWRKGGLCWLSEDDCLYAHRETDILSPDGFRSNPKWTCYHWFRKAPCPSGTRSCLYAHHDTGLHTFKDGKASLKHVTCFWWVTRGICKHREEDCRYAHGDTGLYSRDPSDKRSGTAISHSRPRSWAICVEKDRAEAGQLSPTKNNHGSDLIQVSGSITKLDAIQIHGADVGGSPSPPPSSVDKTSALMPKDSTPVVVRDECRGSHEQDYPSPSVLKVIPLTQSFEECLDENPTSGVDWETMTTRAVSKPAFADIVPMGGSNVAQVCSDKGHSLELSSTISSGETIPQGRAPSDGGGTDNHGVTCQLSPFVAGSNLKNIDPMRDPRRRLQPTTELSNEHPSTTPGGPPVSGSVQSPTSHSPIDTLARLHGADTMHDGHKPRPSSSTSSCKKCKVCAKAVFSGDACRDCRIGTMAPNKPAQRDLQNAGILDAVDPIAVDDSFTAEEILASAGDGLVRSANDTDELKPSRFHKPPLKRTSTVEDLFIPNKRPSSSMLFSSSRRQTTTNPSAGPDLTRIIAVKESVRKPPPPTIHQLLERRRIENNNSRVQTEVDIAICVPPSRNNDAGTSQSDKENETPSAVEDLSPTSAEFVDPSGSISPNRSNRGNSQPPTTMRTDHEVDPSKAVALQSLGKESTDPVRGAKQMSLDWASSSVRSFLQGSGQINRPQEGPGQSPRRLRVNFRCQSCAGKSTPCTHHGWNADDSPEAATIVRLCDAPVVGNSPTPDKQLRTHDQSTSTDRAVPYVCRSCRAHHKRCLHAINSQQFDPAKCRQYLQGRGDKRDTSRSLGEWKRIIEAARPTEKALSVAASLDYDLREAALGRESATILGRGRRRSESVPESLPDAGSDSEDSSVDTDDITLDKYPLRAFLQHHQIREALHEIDILSREDRLPATSRSNLRYDRSHINELKEAGVVFESDEEEDDYYSDDQEAPDTKGPIVDPLRVPPRQSRDLFEICPQLHPRHPKRSNINRPTRDDFTKTSRKAEWAELRSRRLSERHRHVGNPHWEVSRSLAQTKVTSLVERLIPAVDVDVNRFSIPSLQRREEVITFQDFLGVPRVSEASLTIDGSLAFRDSTRDFDQTSFARSARGLGRRLTDEDKFPVGPWAK